MRDAFKNTVLNIYPAYLKRDILNSVVEQDLAINNKKNEHNQAVLNLNDKVDVSDYETLDEKMEYLLQNEEICASIEEYEYRKAYRHFCYFLFNSFDAEKIKELVDDGLVNVFDKKNGYPIDEFDKPSIYSTGDIIYLKFIFNLRNIEGTEIKYVILATLDLTNSVLQVQYDRVKVGFKNSQTFYEDKIKWIINWLQTRIDLEITNINFKAIVDYMIRAEKEISVLAKQMTRNGTTAYLEADENDDIMPILGELDGFIEDNDALFDSNDETREIKKKLLEFKNDIDIKSDLPKVVIRFTDLKLKVGITHNYKGNEYSLFMLYGDLLLEKEVMGNVRDFLIGCYIELNNVAPSISISGNQD